MSEPMAASGSELRRAAWMLVTASVMSYGACWLIAWQVGSAFGYIRSARPALVTASGQSMAWNSLAVRRRSSACL